MLKGGTGMLARVGSARTTRDIDLLHNEQSLKSALADLRRRAAIDLGDFFWFKYTGHGIAVGGQQTHAEGCRISFDIYVGANKRGTLNVVIVVNAVITDEPTVTSPANSLDIPKLPSCDYLVYPVVDQIADKVCTTLTEYSGKPSTREWDLVDLVVLATTENVHSDKLRRALLTESRVRSLALPEHFSIPAAWGRRYAKDAKPIPACANYRTVDLAVALICSFIDPVLRDEITGKTWSHDSLVWH